MKTKLGRGGGKLAALAAVALAPAIATACWTAQEIHLNAGWNGVHIKVNPFAYGCDAVFGGGGIDQVTWWNRDRRNDGTGTVTSDTFAWYLNSDEPNTFGAVLGDERYLIHAIAETNLVIFGTPAIPRGNIHLGEANLVGLNLPTEGGVSLNDYFRYCYGLAPSAYYQVTAANESLKISAGIAPAASQAIWLQTVGEGTEVYTGPLHVKLDTGDKVLQWTTSPAARTVTVKNVTPTNRVVRIDLEESMTPPEGQGTKAGLVRLKRETLDWSLGYARRVYEPVSFPFVTNVAAGATFEFKLRPNLDEMAESEGDYLGILAVSDAGTVVGNESWPGGTCLTKIGVKAAGSLAAEVSPAGLWVGRVALTGINRAKMLSSADPEWNPEAIQDTMQAFQFRLILHTANDGTVKLLKEAFVGTDARNNPDAAVMADRETAKNYRSAHPDGTIRRVSSANFPFMEPRELSNREQFLKGEMTVTFTQAYDAKDNPFMHQFHPEHDNLAFNNGAPLKKEDGAEGTGDYESWPVTRTVALEFAAEDPTGYNEDWNRTVCGGTYTETITGLNKTPIITQGAFRLTKVLTTGVLHFGGVAP